MVEVAALALVAIVVGLFAWIAYVLVGCVKTIAAGLTNTINRLTANDPVANVDAEGVIRNAEDDRLFELYRDAMGWNTDTGTTTYQDPTDDYLPDPGYTGSTAIMGDDPDWPYPGANLGGSQ